MISGPEKGYFGSMDFDTAPAQANELRGQVDWLVHDGDAAFFAFSSSFPFLLLFNGLLLPFSRFILVILYFDLQRLFFFLVFSFLLSVLCFLLSNFNCLLPLLVGIASLIYHWPLRIFQIPCSIYRLLFFIEPLYLFFSYTFFPSTLLSLLSLKSCVCLCLVCCFP
ncbi:hypothetical protein HDV63DRAFT_235592 [Trichoderma sp. SZMC 28014]